MLMDALLWSGTAPSVAKEVWLLWSHPSISVVLGSLMYLYLLFLAYNALEMKLSVLDVSNWEVFLSLK